MCGGLAPIIEVYFAPVTPPSHSQPSGPGWSTWPRASQSLLCISETIWLAQGHHVTGVSKSQDLCRSYWKRDSFSLDLNLGDVRWGMAVVWPLRGEPLWEWSPHGRGLRDRGGDTGFLAAYEPWPQHHPKTAQPSAFLFPEPIQFLSFSFFAYSFVLVDVDLFTTR